MNIPDRQLEPDWPGDESIEEELARRAEIRRNIPDEIIREFVNEAMDDELCEVFRRHLLEHCPTLADRAVIADFLCHRFTTQAEEYVERNLRR